MNNEQLIKQITEQVLKSMSTGATAPSTPAGQVDKSSYPLGEKIPEKIKTPTGVKLSDMSYDKVISGEIEFNDIRISPETLEYQAQVAESVNRDAFARNLRRAAEMIAVPDDRILEIYNSLRPYRSTKAELYAIGEELKTKYGATVTGDFVIEAADIYEKRGRLKKD